LGLSSSGSQPAGTARCDRQFPDLPRSVRRTCGTRARGRRDRRLRDTSRVNSSRSSKAREPVLVGAARPARGEARPEGTASAARHGAARRVGAARRGPRARPWSGAAAAPNEDLGVGEREDVRVDLAFEPRRGRLAGVPGAGGVGGPRRVRTQCPAHQPTPRPEGRGAPAGTRTGIQDLRQMFGEKCPASKPTPRPKGAAHPQGPGRVYRV